MIFPVNKSGEDFGHARMLSPINDKKELTVELSRWPKPSTKSLDELQVTAKPSLNYILARIFKSTCPESHIVTELWRLLILPFKG